MIPVKIIDDRPSSTGTKIFDLFLLVYVSAEISDNVLTDHFQGKHTVCFVVKMGYNGYMCECINKTLDILVA